MKAQCERCGDYGIVRTRDLKGIERVYRCYCEAGKTYSGDYFAPSDKEKLKPFRFPVFREPGPTGRERRVGKEGDDT